MCVLNYQPRTAGLAGHRNPFMSRRRFRLLIVLVVPIAAFWSSSCSKSPKSSGDPKAIETAELAFRKNGHNLKDYSVSVRTNADGRSWVVFFEGKHMFPYGETFAFAITASNSSWGANEIVRNQLNEKEAIALATEVARTHLWRRGLGLEGYTASASPTEFFTNKWLVSFYNSALMVDTEVSVLVDGRTGKATWVPSH